MKYIIGKGNIYIFKIQLCNLDDDVFASFEKHRIQTNWVIVI